jgi:glycerol-3-phosphate acyltransferase PlsY
MLIDIVLIVFAYLLGSMACAILVSKIMGLGDPRTAGSGNPGATNVLRLHGKKAAALTLLGDLLKGLIPVLLARALHAPDPVVALAGLAAFLGHIYPVFFGFRGGKGVATFVGVLLGVHWLVGLGFIGTWLVVAGITRTSSLAALIAAALTPVYTWLILPQAAYISCLSFMVLVLIWRHRSNIRNLLAGTEGKLSSGQSRDVNQDTE